MKKYPKWAKWIAQDKNLKWFIYEHKPEINTIGWTNTSGRFQHVFIKDFTNFWKESLRKLK